MYVCVCVEEVSECKRAVLTLPDWLLLLLLCHTSWKHETGVHRRPNWPSWCHQTSIRWWPCWWSRSSTPVAVTVSKQASDSLVAGDHHSAVMWRLSTTALQILRHCRCLGVLSRSRWWGATVSRRGGWLGPLRGCRRWHRQTTGTHQIWVWRLGERSTSRDQAD